MTVSATQAPAIAARAVSRRFGDRQALREVTFEALPGELVAVIGPNGAGKTTLLSILGGLLKPSGGDVSRAHREVGWVPQQTAVYAKLTVRENLALFARLEKGDDPAGAVDRALELTGLRERALRPLRREVQGVFQDPAASLNPRRRVASIVAAPLLRNGGNRADARERATALLERVELSSEHLHRFPHELSGGQRQRVGIARALALEPRLLILDEPVSALDAPVRAQVMDLLARLQGELGLAYLLISHDLELVGRVADRVAVMDAGALVEEGTARELVEKPSHPATRALVAAGYAAVREPK